MKKSIIFVIGIEGSGHHLFYDLIRSNNGFIKTSFNQESTDYYLNAFKNPYSENRKSIILSGPINQQFKKYFKYLIQMIYGKIFRLLNKTLLNIRFLFRSYIYKKEKFKYDLNKKKEIINSYNYDIFSSSYPYGGNNRFHSYPRIDLLVKSLINKDSDLHLKFQNFYVIRLKRDLIKCADSGLRRGFELNKNPLLSAESAWKSHLEVEYQCNQIKKLNVQVFDLVYEKILDKKERDKVFEKLSDYLELPKEVFSPQFIRKSNLKSLPNKEIVDFFMNREY